MIPEPTDDWDVLFHQRQKRRGFSFYLCCALFMVVVALMLATLVDSYLTNRMHQARNPAAVAAGFVDYDELRTANSAGFANGTAWHEEQARLARQKAEQEAALVAQAKAAKAAFIEANRDPIQKMNLKNSSWEKGGFGSIGIMSVIISNENNFSVKDMTILCAFYAKSGTGLSERLYTIYDTVAANSSKAFRKLNVGFIDSQSAKAGCSLVSAKR